MSDNPFDVFAADFRAAIPTTNEPAKQNEAPINIMAEPASAPVPVMNSPAPPPMNGAPSQPAPGQGPPAPPGQAPPAPAMNGMSMNGSMMGGPPVPPPTNGYGAPAQPYNSMMGGSTTFGNPPPPPANAYGMGSMTMGSSMTAPPPPATNGTANPYGSMNGGMNGSGSMNMNGMNGMNGMSMNGSMMGGAMVPSTTPSNPYASMMGGTAPPPPAAALMAPSPFGAPPSTPGAPSTTSTLTGSMYGAPPTQPAATDTSVAPSIPPTTAPGAVPPSPNPYGAPPPTQPAPNAIPPSPVPPTSAPPAVPPSEPAPVPPVPPSTAVPPPPAAAADPWGAPAPPAPVPAPPVPEPAADPWGAAPVAPAGVPPAGAAPGAIVPSTAPTSDPFDIFAGSPTPAAAPVPVSDGGVFGQAPPADDRSVMTPGGPPAYTQEEALQAADDPWSQMGFGEAPAPTPAATTSPTGGAPPSGDNLLGGDDLAPSVPDAPKEGQLPPGGEWYDARIYTPTLGVMFFKPQELTDSLFLQTDRSLVDALQDRPVVAFIVEGSSARAAGVELGHVLLKVNDIDVKNPKEASRLIKEGPRPLPLLFYVPDTTVVVAEGEHMVKYDTRETGAPNSAKDWKPKYVVIGGIIAQPWMMNMYRSKSEYDIAVIETQARRPVSVKVKQFSLQGARIQNDWQGPQMVKYKNKLHPWKYIVILPVSRNPIKISSPNLSQLKPVHEGVRRVLMAQQRHQPSSAPVQRADPYGQAPEDHGPPAGGGYGGPPAPQQQHGGYGGHPGAHPGAHPGHGGGGSMYETQGGVSSARRSSQY